MSPAWRPPRGRPRGALRPQQAGSKLEHTPSRSPVGAGHTQPNPATPSPRPPGCKRAARHAQLEQNSKSETLWRSPTQRAQLPFNLATPIGQPPTAAMRARVAISAGQSASDKSAPMRIHSRAGSAVNGCSTAAATAAPARAMIDWATHASDKRAPAEVAISRRGAQIGFGRTQRAPPRSPLAVPRLRGALCWLPLLWAWLLVAGPQVGVPFHTVRRAASGEQIVGAEAQGNVDEPSKLEFWRALLERPLSELSGASVEQVSAGVARLANELARWPDQRRAALFYLEVLAKQQQQQQSQAQVSAHARNCARRFHLPELVASDGEFLRLASSPIAQLIGGEALVELCELGDGRLALERTASSPEGLLVARAAQLALDNANLISRLLMHPESGLQSRAFFKYLLKSSLAHFEQRPEPRLLHSLGLAFFESGAEESAGANDELSWAPLALSRPGEAPLLLDLGPHQVVGRGKPLDYFELKRGQPFLTRWLWRRQKERERNEMRALELRLGKRASAELNNDEPPKLELSDGRWFAPYFDCGLANRWLLTFSVPFFAAAAAAGGAQGGASRERRQEAVGEGDASNVKFRGVSFVSLDFGRTRLIDQCASIEQRAPEEASRAGAFPAFFASTHQCAARLKASQCIRLKHFTEVRGGGYACQCARGARLSEAARGATSRRRDELVERLGSIGAPNGSDLKGAPQFEQLALDLDERWADKLFVADELRLERLEKPLPVVSTQTLLLEQARFAQAASAATPTRTERSLSDFLLGAQLDSDAALEWFVEQGGASKFENGKNSFPSSSSFSWPAQACECLANATSGSRLTEPDTPTSGTEICEAGVAAGWEEGEAERSGDARRRAAEWLRPLLLTLLSSCMLLSLALIGLLFRVRKSRIIIQSGWLMLETMLFGALILYASVFVRYFEPTSITCLLEPWLRELGFSVFYGSILIKLYRILTEFQTRKAHRVCLRDKDQVVYLTAIVLIVVGYMSAWTALMVDGFFFAHNQQAQQAQHHQPQQQQQQQHQQQQQQQQQQQNGERDAWAWQPAGSRENQMNYSASNATPDNENNNLNKLLSLHFVHLQQQSANSNLAQTQTQQQLTEQNFDEQPAGARLKLMLERNLNSFGQLFSGLLELQQHYDQKRDTVVYSMRCRKLTWDYVTELSEMCMLVFGIYLVYKLRNASSEVYKEKLVLSGALFVELLVSAFAYATRHLLWASLSSHELLLLYCVRCQLTVSLTLALVFGPKLWSISKARPASSFFSALSTGGGGGAGQAGSASRAAGGSVRHRCHISCELHEHHLNDAMRLHQAMLSNSTLDIGSINLADMDPDEIQAELKRVYAQLEVLKTKVMRRDNPHISKRRGGRKSGHRKFSLQAFHAHAKQIAAGHHHHHAHQRQQPANEGDSMGAQREENGENADQQLNGANQATMGHSQQPPDADKRPLEAASSSSALVYLINEKNSDCQRGLKLSAKPVVGFQDDERLHSERRQTSEANAPSSGQSQAAPSDLKQQQQQQHHHHHHRHHHHQQHRHHHHQHQRHARAQPHHHHQQQQLPQGKSQQQNKQRPVGSDANTAHEPCSTASSACLDDGDTLILNDSQESSENMSSQRRSSFACCQSSMNRDEPPAPH